VRFAKDNKADVGFEVLDFANVYYCLGVPFVGLVLCWFSTNKPTLHSGRAIRYSAFFAPVSFLRCQRICFYRLGGKHKRAAQKRLLPLVA